jgi:hypothetical protein
MICLLVTLVLSVLLLVSVSPLAHAGPTTQAAREIAEGVLQRFGRQAVTEGAEGLARRMEVAAARHGSEVFEAVQKIGPKALTLVEEAGAHGQQAARILAQHGDAGAVWIVARPTAMNLVLRHGEEAAGVLAKHAGGITEPLIEGFGGNAVRALEATGPQGGRRLAMMMADGDLAKIGRTEEILEVVAKYGDRATSFIWNQKGALTVGATLTAFLANPETFLHAAEGVTESVAEHALQPLAEIPGMAVKGVAEGTDWTIVICLVLVAIGCVAAVRFWPKPRVPDNGATPSPGANHRP